MPNGCCICCFQFFFLLPRHQRPSRDVRKSEPTDFVFPIDLETTEMGSLLPLSKDSIGWEGFVSSDAQDSLSRFRHMFKLSDPVDPNLEAQGGQQAEHQTCRREAAASVPSCRRGREALPFACSLVAQKL